MVSSIWWWGGGLKTNAFRRCVGLFLKQLCSIPKANGAFWQATETYCSQDVVLRYPCHAQTTLRSAFLNRSLRALDRKLRRMRLSTSPSWMYLLRVHLYLLAFHLMRSSSRILSYERRLDGARVVLFRRLLIGSGVGVVS